ALGISAGDVAAGLRDFKNTAEHMPGRMNLYARGDELAMIDYAHNEAGLEALLQTAQALLGKRGKRRATMTVVIGTAGDRPDDSLRAIGKLAGQHGDRVAIKESLTFLRGRTRAGMIGELMAGVRSSGRSAGEVTVYVDELGALKGELAAVEGRPHVIVEMCHEQRTAVRGFLLSAGFEQVEDPRTLTRFRP
ncbi:MAG TPA: cyanophycin synthetase, partial [Candidatus Limnocylindrales bacterium]